jgi:hypothetical protein
MLKRGSITATVIVLLGVLTYSTTPVIISHAWYKKLKAKA